MWFAGSGHSLAMAPGREPGASAEPPPAPPSPTPSATPDIANDMWLVGEYRVAGVDGAAIDLQHAATVSIDTTRISFASECIAARWSYRLRNESIGTEAIPTIACQRGLYPQERAMMEALGAATRATRTPANGIELSGGGTSITLFSQ